ncbi:MAG TPA: thiamine ABC transporter substrate-binding protein [Acidimicrobiia bacterium]|nr:thiamine ABC transporter substrate-binding protein [Acidimicrobiia bacterium]
MTGRRRRVQAALATLVGLALVVSACGDDDDVDATAPESVKVRLLTHDSFALSDGVLDRLREESGIELEVIAAGDAGSVVNQAILTASDPLADVLYGVDSTFLGRALAEDLFVPYEAAGLDAVPTALQLDPQHRVTPIDVGDVCVNYDRAHFGEELAAPTTLESLTDAEYRGLTVVENPATSSTGLAFLLATVAEYGADGWRDYWQRLRDNDVLVADSWEDAYYGAFSAGGGGDRPIVVSYASSPPADVVFAEDGRTEPAIGVVEQSCYRQVEFAGILRGTAEADAAERVVDFLLSPAVQADIPLQMFVFPARADVELPEVFERWAARPVDPYELELDVVDARRDEWIEEWTDLVVR